MSAKAIKVPQVPGPRAVLCYVTPPLDGSRGNPMVHCDRKHGHGGRHSWELDAAPAAVDVEALAARIERLPYDAQAAARGFGDLVRRNSVLEILRSGQVKP